MFGRIPIKLYFSATRILFYTIGCVVFCTALSSCSQPPAEHVDNGRKVYHRSGEVGVSMPLSASRSHAHSYNASSQNAYGSGGLQNDSADDYNNYDQIGPDSDRVSNGSEAEYFDDPFVVDSSGNFALSNPMGNSRFIWPLDGRVIKHYNKNAGIEGVNITAPLNTPVRASSNGRVIYVGDDLSEYGKLIIVKHDDDLLTAYAHLDGFMINKGDIVERGQIIGTVGKSGEVNSSQLHFSIRKDDKTINPEVVM